MNAVPATIVAILVGVTDGDTIKVWRDRQVETIRLACIDAPELRQQPWGIAARDRLLELAPIGSSVEVRPISRDRYGRTVAEVSTKSQNLNLFLVQGGYAVVYLDRRECPRHSCTQLGGGMKAERSDDSIRPRDARLSSRAGDGRMDEEMSKFLVVS